MMAITENPQINIAFCVRSAARSGGNFNIKSNIAVSMRGVYQPMGFNGRHPILDVPDSRSKVKSGVKSL